MYTIDFSKHSVNWFQSYLINGTFLVNLGNVFSELACVYSGVPQGPILDPLLLPIYINDMSQAVRCNIFFTLMIHILLVNKKILMKLIQPHFDYACYLNLTKKLRNRIQTSQNKHIRFCLQLDKMTHISRKEFETLKWLPVTERFNQCITQLFLSTLMINALNM